MKDYAIDCSYVAHTKVPKMIVGVYLVINVRKYIKRKKSIRVFN